MFVCSKWLNSYQVEKKLLSDRPRKMATIVKMDVQRNSLVPMLMMITYFNFQRFHNYFLMAQNEFIQKLYQSAHFTRWDF